jgi:hypothetical protein
MTCTRTLTLLVLAIALTVGCNRQEAPKPMAGAQFRLHTEPKGAISVSQLKTTADSEVAVAGCIGGESNPWVDGMAAFVLADETVLAHCRAESADKNCHCPAKGLNEATVLVKFVDATGEPLPVDSRKLLSVNELDRVVVKGKAERDADGNVVIVAGGIYVRR